MKRFILIIIILCLISACTACASLQQSNMDSSATEFFQIDRLTSSGERMSASPSSTTFPVAKSGPYQNYNDVIDAYRNYVNALCANALIASPDTIKDPFDEIFYIPSDDNNDTWENDLDNGLWEAVLMNSANNSNGNKEYLGYAIKDLNGDDIPELILLVKDYTKNYKDYIVIAVFSLANKKPHLLDGFWSRHKCVIDASGSLYVLGSNGADDFELIKYKISQDGQLVQAEKYASEPGGVNGVRYYKVINGETQTITESEFNEYRTKVDTISTKDAGLDFVPLFAN